MPIKEDAEQLLNNKLFKLLTLQLEAEYFEHWRAAKSVEDRELIYSQCTAMTDLIALIDSQAAEYTNVVNLNDK